MFFLRKILDRIWFNRFFLLCVLILYFVFFIFAPDWWIRTLQKFLVALKWIIPVLFFVYFFIFFFNLIVNNTKIKEKLKISSNFFKYIISVFGWIISTGPVYLWFPFLKQLKEYWLNNWHITSFIYARAIKIPMFPLMIWYFWLFYTIVFNSFLLISAFLIGPLLNLFFKQYLDENNNSIS